jgi:hypothetical protein
MSDLVRLAAALLKGTGVYLTVASACLVTAVVMHFVSRARPEMAV